MKKLSHKKSFIFLGEKRRKFGRVLAVWMRLSRKVAVGTPLVSRVHTAGVERFVMHIADLVTKKASQVITPSIPSNVSLEQVALVPD
jgi:hypothetical protein